MFQEGCRRLVEVCADLRPHQSVLIVGEEKTGEVARAVLEHARRITERVVLAMIPGLTMHGQEPPPPVAPLMLQSDVIFGLTSMSMAHSQARLEASLAGARYLSLPDYSSEILASPAMQADFRALTRPAEHLAQIFSQGSEIHLTTPAGTDLRCNVTGRTANSAPGWCWGPGSLASPPDAEVNIAVQEDQTRGLVVVDGSIPCPAFGLMDAPLSMVIEGGAATRLSGPGWQRLKRILDELNDPKTRVVAEFGLGLNPLARLCGRMLEDEGCRGTVHLGLGSNCTIGGINQVPFHLDFVLRQPTVRVDGRIILHEGIFSEELT